MKPIKISDLSLRDGFQSLFGSRGRTQDMVLLAKMMDEIGYDSVEVWGGTIFDVMHRYLNEDPWERIRQLGRYFVKTPMSMLLRGKNLVGHQPYPKDISDAFIERAVSNGIKKIRVYDALNDFSNLSDIAQKTKSEKAELDIAVCYSLTSSHGLLREEIYNKEYYLEKAKKAEDLGADIFTIKDLSGVLSPYDAFELIGMLKKGSNLKIALNTHSQTGMAPMTQLKAAEAGADIIDTCINPFAYRTSQPAVEPLLTSLLGSGMDPLLDMEKITEAGIFAEEAIIPKYREYLNEEKVSLIDTNILTRGFSSNICTNIDSQLKESRVDKDREEIFNRLGTIRKDIGFPPLVSSNIQMISVQAVNNFLFDEKEGEYRLISDNVRKLISGKYGDVPGEISDYLKEKSEEFHDEPGDFGVGLRDAGKNLKGLAADIEDELIYALFPRTGKRFLKWKYGLEEAPEETKPVSFEAARKRMEEVQRIISGKSAEEDTGAIPDKGPGTRSFNVFVGDEFFEVSVDPGEDIYLGRPGAVSEEKIMEYIETKRAVVEKKQPVKEIPQVKKEPLVELVREEKVKMEDSDFFFLKAPMPGSIASLRKKKGDQVKKDEIILVLEAMKMENPLTSPINGTIKEIRCSGGDQVPKDSVLCVIECS